MQVVRSSFLFKVMEITWQMHCMLKTSWVWAWIAFKVAMGPWKKVLKKDAHFWSSHFADSHMARPIESPSWDTRTSHYESLCLSLLAQLRSSIGSLPCEDFQFPIVGAHLIEWLLNLFDGYNYSDKRHRSNAATCLEKIQVINGLNRLDGLKDVEPYWTALKHQVPLRHNEGLKKQTVPTRRLLIAMPGHQHRREACRHLSGWIVWRFRASTFCSIINNKSIYNKVYIQRITKEGKRHGNRQAAKQLTKHKASTNNWDKQNSKGGQRPQHQRDQNWLQAAKTLQ